MSGLLIVGAGGHGKVIADTANETNKWEKIAFIDDKYPVLGDALGWPVIGKIEQAELWLKDYSDLVVAVGNNHLRAEFIERFRAMGYNLPNIIHPQAWLSKSVTMGSGNVFFAKAVVNATTILDNGVIVNTGATVDHDCVIGDCVHLSPGVHVGGEVTIGKNTWIGIGASIKNSINVGENVIVGAGAVITKPVINDVMVIGIPGRVVKCL